jgi:hypothetical protein
LPIAIINKNVRKIYYSTHCGCRLKRRGLKEGVQLRTGALGWNNYLLSARE